MDSSAPVITHINGYYFNYPMDKSLVVFQENDLYFGIYPNEFKHNFSLSQVWISRPEKDSPIWRFTRKKDPIEGNFIHFGALLGLSQSHFNNGGYIFIKEVSNTFALGICFSGLLMHIPLKKIPQKRIEVDAFSHFPPDIPKTVFSFIQVYKGKHIYVIDPLLLFRAYDLLG